MNYYIEIKLLNNAEIGLGFLWQKVFTQIHIALADTKENIGISFIEYGSKKFPLGQRLRLFAESKKIFNKLNIEKWLERLIEYVEISSIMHTPSNVMYATFSRKQIKTGIPRLARRYAKRHGISYEQALDCYKEIEEIQIKLPFINIISSSTKQPMKIFIQQSIQNKFFSGEFNSYGLSKDGTNVPWF